LIASTTELPRDQLICNCKTLFLSLLSCSLSLPFYFILSLLSLLSILFIYLLNFSFLFFFFFFSLFLLYIFWGEPVFISDHAVPLQTRLKHEGISAKKKPSAAFTCPPS